MLAFKLGLSKKAKRLGHLSCACLGNLGCARVHFAEERSCPLTRWCSMRSAARRAGRLLLTMCMLGSRRHASLQ